MRLPILQSRRSQLRMEPNAARLQYLCCSHVAHICLALWSPGWHMVKARVRCFSRQGMKLKPNHVLGKVAVMTTRNMYVGTRQPLRGETTQTLHRSCFLCSPIRSTICSCGSWFMLYNKRKQRHYPPNRSPTSPLPPGRHILLGWPRGAACSMALLSELENELRNKEVLL